MTTIQGNEMTDKPWARLGTPAQIPDQVNAEHLRHMDQADFDLLLRSHLVPRENSSSYRRNWNRLWALLRTDADLNRETYDLLTDWLDQAHHIRDEYNLEPVEAKRVRKFAATVDDCRKRLTRIEALDWTGTLAAEHPEQSRVVIGALVGAVARHRSTTQHTQSSPTTADTELWGVLRQLKMDPLDYPNLDRK